MKLNWSIFTWPESLHQLHGFAHTQWNIFIPSGKTANFELLFKDLPNAQEVEPDQVKNLKLDVILFQNPESYFSDQFRLFSETQLTLPKIYLENQPPKLHPTNTSHALKDPEILLVYTNFYNAFMWDNNGLPAKVIEPGVTDEGALYTGNLAKGVVVLDEEKDARVGGDDILSTIKEALPLDIMRIGQNGLTYQNLPEKIKDYRFLYCPDRYATPPLTVFKAMMLGMPVAGLATTALPTIIEDGFCGFVNSELTELTSNMQQLISNHQLAKTMGARARLLALQDYNLEKFKGQWQSVLQKTVNSRTSYASNQITVN